MSSLVQSMAELLVWLELDWSHHTAVILLWVHSRQLSKTLSQPSMATRCFCGPKSSLANICISRLLQQDIPCVDQVSAAG